ncbi:MAG: helix-turn-helix transcriptional regulator, partial [Myxococcales bacterium]|nr:helix-turn-helix transcriptional regulator [Myxococcales bacterium]
YRRVLQGLFGQSSELLLQSELRKLGPDWMYTLGVKGVRDVFFLKCDHIDGHGTTVFATGLPATPVLTPRQRQLYLMLSAHLKAGYRLRRQLAATQQDADALEPDDGAILDAASMRVVHAEGSAQASTAQAALVEMARNIDRARAQQSGRDERAVEVWQGLVDGRWSLVERFDADGRRFVVAHKNSENVRDQLGLTQMEARVAALASRGHSNKLIAYHLGISEGTASSHLHGAMAKLRVSSRVELVRLIAHSETKAWS